MQDLVFGAKEAANVIGISYRTLCRYLQRQDFPKPDMEQERAQGGGILRWWKKKDLLKFREKIYQESCQKSKSKGRPLGMKIGDNNAKMAE